MDGNLFMMCERLNPDALTPMPEGVAIRYCRKDELALWKSFHFDTAELAEKNEPYMTAYFDRVYAPAGKLFFDRCLFAVKRDTAEPVATCFMWRAYGKFTTIHWFKSLKSFESKGIGRALLSQVMGSIAESDYPVYLHIQPDSFRAIKLYNDFGFSLADNPKFGNRSNDLKESLPYLEKVMTATAFSKLRYCTAPKDFIAAIEDSTTDEF
jgi:ribosomal protein S18 acetylase RimI-like enzyme